MAVYCIRDLDLSDSASLAALLAASSDTEPTVRVAAVTSLKTRRRWRPRRAPTAARAIPIRYAMGEFVTPRRSPWPSWERRVKILSRPCGPRKRARTLDLRRPFQPRWRCLKVKGPLQATADAAVEAGLSRWTEGDSQAPGRNPRQRFRLEPKSQPPRSQYINQSCLDHLLSLLNFSLRKWFSSVNNRLNLSDKKFSRLR